MTKYLIILAAIFFVTVGTAEGRSLFERGVCNGDDPPFDHVLNCVQTSGHHVYEVEEVCPLGGEKFKALELGTHSTYGRSLDWEPLSYMRFPVPLPVCPKHGFVVLGKDYSKEELDSLKKVIESEAYRDLFRQKHATFFLYAKTFELREKKSDDLWWWYLNATWEADLCDNETRYKEYALATIAAGTKRIAELKETDEIYWVLKIIVPNMHRRIGDFETARKSLDKIGKPALADKEANEYFELAIKLLREAIDKKNTERVPIRAEKDEES